MFIIPFISAGLYLAGGQWNKWYRWGMGIPIALTGAVVGHSWIPLLCIPTYFIATNAFSYGDKMWTTKLFGKWASMIISGVALGAASAPVLAWWAIPQAIFGGLAFGLLKWLDDTNKLKNPWQELLRGFLGTAFFL